jgi:hypothetical protein
MRTIGYIHIYIYIYIYTYVYQRFGGGSPIYPTPSNWEINLFRVRFCFVPCVPCVWARRSCVGACGTLFLSPGLSRARIHVCAYVMASILCAQARGL